MKFPCGFLFSFACLFFAASASAQSANHTDRPPANTLTSSTLTSPTQASANERFLFESLNRERTDRGLAALQWDSNLASAAHLHAQQMMDANNLSHQLPGEPELLARLSGAGARFSSIAENIAEGSDTAQIHDGWMHSPGHRANILDSQSTAVGIAVVQGKRQLFAVQDFSRVLESLDFAEQEKRVSALLAAYGLRIERKSEEARKNCDSNYGISGVTAISLIRFDVADLTSLPEVVGKKIEAHSFQKAAVGACSARSNSGFAHYRLVVLLY